MDATAKALDELRPDLRAAVLGHGLPLVWPEAAHREAWRLGKRVKPADIRQRLDLRGLPWVTIDGEDARDFDDAVFARREEAGGWTLFVAIADVSHYVAPGSALDLEARERGTSAYFPDYVIPMLPEELSNELCSLKPRVDRLALVCEMRMDAVGAMLDYCFHEAVVHSHARLTYTEVAELVSPPQASAEGKSQSRLASRLAPLAGHLADLHELFMVLHRRRGDAGSIEFETLETRIVLDKRGEVREIVPIARNDAHRLIEECMLCANVAAAKMLQESGLPVLFRVHQGPDPEKLADLREYLRGLGLSLGGGSEPRPAHYRRLLRQCGERPDRELLQGLLIRSLSQARYQPENIGHFGLNFPRYAHFTSPIRRYPDLLVHRAIRYLIRRRGHPAARATAGADRLSRGQAYPYNAFAMEELGESCSAAERRADAAGYLSVNWLKCEFLRRHIGDDFDGVISAVTGFGLFVQVAGFHIDGLVHISMLGDDYYQHDPVRHFLEGENRGRVFRLGDPLRVQVISVIPEEQKIELRLAGGSEPPAVEVSVSPRRRRSRRGNGRGAFRGRGKRGPDTDRGRRR